MGIEWSTGFCLGYLRGRSFPQNAQLPPPKNIVIITVQLYLSNYIGKIILTRRGQCTWSKYFLSKDTIWQGTWSWLKNKILYHCNILQNCTRLFKMRQIASQHIFIKKISGGHAPGSHQEASGLWPLRTFPPVCTLTVGLKLGLRPLRPTLLTWPVYLTKCTLWELNRSCNGKQFLSSWGQYTGRSVQGCEILINFWSGVKYGKESDKFWSLYCLLGYSLI